MMEAAPPSPLVMSEPELLLEFLVVALDAPAELCHVDQAGEGNVGRQGGEPVFGRFSLALGPFDEKPFLGSGFGKLVVAMGGADPDAGVARDQPVRGALAPGDGFPGLRRKAQGQRLGLDRLVLVVTPHPAARAAAPGPGLGRQRPGSWERRASGPGWRPCLPRDSSPPRSISGDADY